MAGHFLSQGNSRDGRYQAGPRSSPKWSLHLEGLARATERDLNDSTKHEQLGAQWKGGQRGHGTSEGCGTAAAVHMCRACRRAEWPCLQLLRRVHLVVFAYPMRTDTTVTSIKPKAIARRSAATQTELPQKHKPVQACNCRECLSLALAPKDRRDYTWVQWEQVDDLLSLVAELREEVESLKSIRGSDRKIDWWKFLRDAGGGSSEQVRGTPTLLSSDRRDLNSKETGSWWGPQENHHPCLHRQL